METVYALWSAGLAADSSMDARAMPRLDRKVASPFIMIHDKYGSKAAQGEGQ